MTAKRTDKSGPRVWIVLVCFRDGVFFPRREAWPTRAAALPQGRYLRELYGPGNVRVVEYRPVERG